MSLREGGSMGRLISAGVLACVLCATIMPGAQGATSEDAIPDLSSADLAWVKIGDDFIAPPTGPHPVTFDKAHPRPRHGPSLFDGFESRSGGRSASGRRRCAKACWIL